MTAGLLRGHFRTPILALLFGVISHAFIAPANAQSKPLQKVRFMIATNVFDVTYSEFSLPTTLGYWRDEGLDVDIQPAGGSLQAFQQIAGGGAELAAGSGNALITASVKANLPLRVAMTMKTADWAVGVDANGPIKSVKDLKGKTIGVLNLATGGIPFLNDSLLANGLDPSKDIDLVATSMGATPVQALQSGRVQGLLYWGSAIASFENSGLKLREIGGDDWSAYPDYAIGVHQAVVDKDPAMIVGVLRGMAKSTAFLSANPSCALKLHWAAYPASKAAGVDEAVLLKRDLHSIDRQLKSIKEAYALYGKNKVRGAFDAAAWDQLIAFMLRSKQIDKAISAQSINAQIPDLDRRVNAFDLAAVQESAKACKF